MVAAASIVPDTKCQDIGTPQVGDHQRRDHGRLVWRGADQREKDFTNRHGSGSFLAAPKREPTASHACRGTIWVGDWSVTRARVDIDGIDRISADRAPIRPLARGRFQTGPYPNDGSFFFGISANL